MAINNTDNPEEGTPRDKKDIRRERRQMKSINRQRKAMGGDPLYVKKDFEEIKKPFSGKGNVLTGEEDFLKGSKTQVTYNDPNKPSEPDYEYKIYESGGPGVSETTITAPVTKEQFQALTSDNPKEGEVVRQAILSKAYSDPNATPSTIKTAQGIADAAKNETDNLVNKIETEIKDEVELKDKVGGSGETINPIVNGVDPNATNWVNVTKYKDGYQLPSDEDIYTRANLAKKKAPQLVVEKLGVQDYYPEIGRDIAVGNFSGSYAGSRTIYSGAGGLLPLGLYDARKRAIAAEIKRKEALMSELSEIPDISKQFQPYFSGQYVEGLNKFVNAYKDNPDGLMNDPEFRKFQAHYKSIGENFLKVSDDLKEFEKLIQPGDKGADKGGYGSYATPGMLEILYKFKSGFLPDKIEDWFSGKKNISTLTETVRALPNGYKIIGEKINDLLKTNQIERTIKPKTGEEIDWAKAKDEINSIAQQVNDGSSDYESYLSVVKKYYDIDVKPLVEQFVNGNSLGALTDKEKEEYIKSLTLYAEAQIPDKSMISKIDRQNNDNAARYAADQALKGKLAAINWDKEKWEREQRQNPTNALIDAAMLSPSGTFTQDYAGSRANLVPLNKLNATVIDKNGKKVTITGSQLRAAPKGTYRSTIDNQPIDPENLPTQVTYQATQGTVRSIGAGDYIYSNSGLGYTATAKADKNGNIVQDLKGLGVEFSMPDVPAVKGGKKIESTIDGGNVFFGQGANQQTYKTRQSSGSNSFERGE